jgi:diguanylate cyclase (GGDEF)-like protein
LTCSCAALAAALWRMQSCVGPRRRSWMLVSCAMGSAAAGEAVWGYFEMFAGHEVPTPSLSDVFYLAFYPLVVAGLLLRPSRPPSRSERVQATLDGVLIAASLFALSTVTILGPLLRAGGLSRWGLIVSVSYPLCDVLAVTVSLLAIARHGADRTTGPLAIGLCAWAIGDSVFTGLAANGVYSSGSITDAVYISGYLLFIEAAIGDTGRTRRTNPPSDISRTRPVSNLPFVPAALGIGVGSWQLLSPNHDLLSGVAVIVVMAVVLARQWLSHRENRLLLEAVLAQQELLRAAAYHDSLTGLANRALFTERLEHALAAQRRDPTPLAVLLLDLDDFKTINDTRGHASGDALLVAVAERLRTHTRAADTVARLGGDEFALIIEGSPNPAKVASRLLRVLTEPTTIAGYVTTITASIGIAAIDHKGGNRDNLDGAELLARADIAMYAAKRAGKSIALPYTEPTNALTESSVDSGVSPMA